MKLLVTTVRQFAVILVVVNVVVLATDHFQLGDTGWWIADIALIALGVFFVRIYQEIAFAAFRSGPED